MKTLSTVENPHLEGSVVITAQVRPKRGDDFYICNPWEEVMSAIDKDKPFIAHGVVGMRPQAIIVMPGTIAFVENLG